MITLTNSQATPPSLVITSRGGLIFPLSPSLHFLLPIIKVPRAFTAFIGKIDDVRGRLADCLKFRCGGAYVATGRAVAFGAILAPSVITFTFWGGLAWMIFTT